MFEFNFHIPTSILFGKGKVDNVGDVVSAIGSRVLLVAGVQSASASGLLDRIEMQLSQRGCVVSTFMGVRPNPTLEQVESGIQQATKAQTDVIVAVGGGSVCDTARAIALGVTHEGNLWDYRITGSKSVAGIQDVLVPVITVPTIAGTGSELSAAFLLTKGVSKEVFFSPYLFPRSTIVDPSLAMGAPALLSVEVGFDAFVQGLEAFMSRSSTPFSDAFALQAMKLAVDNLKQLSDGENTTDIRENLALAALFSLFAVNQAGVGGVHALSDPLSGHYNVAHGVALASVITAVVSFNLDANYSKYARVAEILGSNCVGVPLVETAQQAVVEVRALVKKLGIFRTLSSLGMSRQDIPVFVQEAQNPDMASNPKSMSEHDITALYTHLL